MAVPQCRCPEVRRHLQPGSFQTHQLHCRDATHRPTLCGEDGEILGKPCGCHSLLLDLWAQSEFTAFPGQTPSNLPRDGNLTTAAPSPSVTVGLHLRNCWDCVLVVVRQPQQNNQNKKMKPVSPGSQGFLRAHHAPLLNLFQNFDSKFIQLIPKAIGWFLSSSMILPCYLTQMASSCWGQWVEEVSWRSATWTAAQWGRRGHWGAKPRIKGFPWRGPPGPMICHIPPTTPFLATALATLFWRHGLKARAVGQIMDVSTAVPTYSPTAPLKASTLGSPSPAPNLCLCSSCRLT